MERCHREECWTVQGFGTLRDTGRIWLGWEREPEGPLAENEKSRAHSLVGDREGHHPQIHTDLMSPYGGLTSGAPRQWVLRRNVLAPRWVYVQAQV